MTGQYELEMPWSLTGDGIKYRGVIFVAKSKLMLGFAVIGLLFMHGSIVNAVGKEKQTLLVAEYVKGTVYAIDAETHKVKGALPSSDFSAMAIAEDKARLYFVYSFSVDVVRKTDLAKLAEIEFDGYGAPGLTNARVGFDGRILYIGIIGWGESSTTGIYTIDLRKQKQRDVLMKNEIQSGVLDTSVDGGKLYYAGMNGIYSLDTRSASVLKIAPLDKNEVVRDIVHGEPNILYVALSSAVGSEKHRNVVMLLDLNTNKTKRRVLPSLPERVRLTRDGRLYILCAEALLQIKAANLDIEKSYVVSGKDLAITKDGSELFISSPLTGEVIALDPSSGNIVARIKVGENPYALHLF